MADNLMEEDPDFQQSYMKLEDVRDIWLQVKEEIQRVVIGKVNVVEDMMITLLAEGHVLLEGVPGIAKTFITNAFADIIGLNFARAQFTPDLLPSDLLGTNIYDPKNVTFKLKRGPIFTNFLLADEINRSPPKTQAALLEAMAEGQVSIEGETYLLDKPFIVVATQNPIEQEGTYPLPEAQIDRFGMKIVLDLPAPNEELEIIKLKHNRVSFEVRKVITDQTLLEMIQSVKRTVYISPEVLTYIRDLVISTRTDPRLILGCSPRASLAILGHCKAYAAMQGRYYVIPDDVKRVSVNSVHHRLQLKSEIELEGATGRVVIEDILNTVAVPM